MRKPAFCICENKDADQLRSNCAADQRLCFRYTDSTIPLLPRSEFSSLIRIFKSLAIFCGCTAWFVSDLVGNPEDRFSQNEAHITATNIYKLQHCQIFKMLNLLATGRTLLLRVRCCGMLCFVFFFFF